MSLAKLIWEQLRRLNRVPGAHAAYQRLTNWALRDGRSFRLRLGPAAGLRWRHNSIHQPWMTLGMYEPHVATEIYSSLHPGQVFYDVGANAGYFTLVAAKAVGPDGYVVAFDPHPRNAAAIHQQVALNAMCDWCRVEQVAIADHVGRASFSLCPCNANSHLVDFVAPNLRSTTDLIDVEVETLDHITARLPNPHLVKIDIEGAEVAALRGAQRLLTALPRPRWLVSTHSDSLREEASEMLAQAGYTFRQLPGFEQMIYAQPDVGG